MLYYVLESIMQRTSHGGVTMNFVSVDGNEFTAKDHLLPVTRNTVKFTASPALFFFPQKPQPKSRALIPCDISTASVIDANISFSSFIL